MAWLSCRAVWCGVVWCGTVSCGAARYDAVAVRYSTVRCGIPWCGTVQCGAVRCGVVGCGAARSDVVRCGAERRGAMQVGVGWVPKGAVQWSRLQGGVLKCPRDTDEYHQCGSKGRPYYRAGVNMGTAVVGAGGDVAVDALDVDTAMARYEGRLQAALAMAEHTLSWTPAEGVSNAGVGMGESKHTELEAGAPRTSVRKRKLRTEHSHMQVRALAQRVLDLQREWAEEQKKHKEPTEQARATGGEGRTWVHGWGRPKSPNDFVLLCHCNDYGGDRRRGRPCSHPPAWAVGLL